MGCSNSKPNGENNAEAMLSVCKERKRLMKLAIRRRHAIAIAHFKYTQSLFSLATAIKAFAGSQKTRLLITEPIPERETEEKQDNEDENDDERDICEHFYDNNDNGLTPLMQNVVENDGNYNEWDFFNLFDGWKTEVVSVYNSEREVKQGKSGEVKQGKSEKVVSDANVSRGDIAGKELFEGLRLVEESFVKGSECGAEVSRMLEVSAGHHLESGFDKFQESPMKSHFQSISPLKSPFQSIAWGRSMSSSSSSCKSFFSFSSPCSSTWTDVNIDYFDEHNGMVSGSHSLTLGRLYAWENKLYEEVKVGEHMRKIYQQKCWQLKNQDAKYKEKTKAEVRDLYSRILVAIRRTETISQKIQKLKDDELYPQLVELLNGFMSTWNVMMETHKAQKEAISEVKKFTHKNFTDSHRLNTFQLETEVQNWCFCFSEYLSAQKGYAQTLNGWLSKFVSPQVKSHGIGKFLGMPSNDDPLSFYITRDWLNLLYNLLEKPVTCAMKSLGKEMRALWAQQGDEQLLKRKVDGLTKELDRSMNALKREEEKKVENASYRVEYLNDRKRLLEDLRKKLKIEEERYRDSTEETQRNTLHVFQSGFGSVFDSMIEFSKASLKMYADLVADNEKKVHK